MNGSFAHLRVSSEYSIFKGLLSIEKLVEKAKKLQIQHMNDFNNGKIEAVKTYEPNEAIGGK